MTVVNICDSLVVGGGGASKTWQGDSLRWSRMIIGTRGQPHPREFSSDSRRVDVERCGSMPGGGGGFDLEGAATRPEVASYPSTYEHGAHAHAVRFCQGKQVTKVSTFATLCTAFALSPVSRVRRLHLQLIPREKARDSLSKSMEAIPEENDEHAHSMGMPANSPAAPSTVWGSAKAPGYS